MTDYYTSFSFLIPVPDEEKRKELALKIQSEIESLSESVWGAEEDVPELEIFGDWVEEGYVPDLNVAADSDGLWFFADEAGDVEAAALVTAWVLDQLPDGPDYIGFGFANTAGRPVLGAYSGGECVVTKEETFWFPPYDRMMKKVQELKDQGLQGEVA